MAENAKIAALRGNTGNLARSSGPQALNFPWMNGQQSGAFNFAPRKSGGLNRPQRLTMPEAAPVEPVYGPETPWRGEDFIYDPPIDWRAPAPPPLSEVIVDGLEVPLTVPVDPPWDFAPIPEPEPEPAPAPPPLPKDTNVYQQYKGLEVEVPYVPETTPLDLNPPAPVDVAFDFPEPPPPAGSVTVEELPTEPEVDPEGDVEVVEFLNGLEVPMPNVPETTPFTYQQDNQALFDLWLRLLNDPTYSVEVEEFEKKQPKYNVNVETLEL